MGVDEQLRPVCSKGAEKLRVAGRPGAVHDRPWQVERGREQVGWPDTTIDRLVVLLTNAGDETVSEIEIHRIASSGCSTYTTTYARRICTRSGDEETMTTLSSLLDHLYQGDVVDTADLARVSDTNARSVARWKAEAAAPRREAEERLLELRAVVDLTRRVMRDDAARLWMRSPNPDLDYEKPLDLIASGQYQRVVDLLLALAEGVTI